MIVCQVMNCPYKNSWNFCTRGVVGIGKNGTCQQIWMKDQRSDNIIARPQGLVPIDITLQRFIPCFEVEKYNIAAENDYHQIDFDEYINTLKD